MFRSRTRAGLATVIAAAAAFLTVAPLTLTTAVAHAATAVPDGSPAVERTSATIRPAIVSVEGTFSGYVVADNGAVLNDLFNNGKPYETSLMCTGFGVNPNGYVATAGHCVAPEDVKVDILTLAAQQMHDYDPTLDVASLVTYGLGYWSVEGAQKGTPIDSQLTVVRGATSNGATQSQTFPARVVDYRSFTSGDVALLKIETTDLPSSQLATDADVQVGTPVVSVGYAGNVMLSTDPSLEPTNKDGTISSKRTWGNIPVYEITAMMAAGVSGGPSVATDGRVLGMNSHLAEEGQSQAYFITPASVLSELLNRNGVRNELGPDDVTYRSGLQAYFTGHYSDAIAAFDKVLTVAPQFGQATQYKTLAAKARDRFGDASDPAAWIWYAASGAAVVVLIGTTLLVVHRRARRGSTPAEGVPGRLSGPPTGPPTDHGGAVPTVGSVAPGPVRAWAGSADLDPGTVGRAGPETSNGSTSGSLRADTAVLTNGHRPGSGDCPSCGAPHGSDSRFCATCGARL